VRGFVYYVYIIVTGFLSGIYNSQYFGPINSGGSCMYVCMYLLQY
jgi:hypothetical protein